MISAAIYLEFSMLESSCGAATLRFCALKNPAYMAHINHFWLFEIGKLKNSLPNWLSPLKNLAN